MTALGQVEADGKAICETSAGGQRGAEPPHKLGPAEVLANALQPVAVVAEVVRRIAERALTEEGLSHALRALHVGEALTHRLLDGGLALRDRLLVRALAAAVVRAIGDAAGGVVAGGVTAGGVVFGGVAGGCAIAC